MLTVCVLFFTPRRPSVQAFEMQISAPSAVPVALQEERSNVEGKHAIASTFSIHTQIVADVRPVGVFDACI